jgi:hypothetical protein
VYLLIVFSLVGTFSAGGIGMRVLTGTAAAPSNPFAAFADVFPGQSRGAAVARGFLCFAGNAPGSEDLADERCILRPGSGAFSQVEVFTSGSVIRRLDFEIRQDELRLGDLILFWGVPEVQVYDRAVYVVWRSLGISTLVTRHSKEFSLFLPVQRVYLFAVQRIYLSD